MSIAYKTLNIFIDTHSSVRISVFPPITMLNKYYVVRLPTSRAPVRYLCESFYYNSRISVSLFNEICIQSRLAGSTHTDWPISRSKILQFANISILSRACLMCLSFIKRACPLHTYRSVHVTKNTRSKKKRSAHAYGESYIDPLAWCTFKYTLYVLYAIVARVLSF